MKIINRFSRRVKRWRDRRVRERLEIILYHSVSADDSFYVKSNHNIHPSIFKKQLKYLKNNFTIVAMSEIKHLYLEKRSGKGPYACICFDDGYRNNLTEAYPILETLEIPATIFVCPSVIDNKDLLWRDKIRYLLENNLVDTFFSFLKKAGESSKYKFERFAGSNFYQWSKDEKSLTDMSIQKDLNIFFLKMGISPSELARDYDVYLKREDLLKESSLLEFGNHTWSHPIMTLLTYEEQRSEITCAHEFLVSDGVEPYALALPFSPFNDDTLKICREIGYKYILTVYNLPNLVTRRDHDGEVNIFHRTMASTTLEGFEKIFSPS